MRALDAQHPGLRAFGLVQHARRHQQGGFALRHFNIHRDRHVLAQKRRGLGHVKLDIHRAGLRVDAGVDVDQGGVKVGLRIGVRRHQRLLAQGQQVQVFFVNGQHQLRAAQGRERHQQLARLHHVPSFHAAADQHPVHRRANLRVLAAGPRGSRAGLGLGDCRLRNGKVAALRSGRCELLLGRTLLRLRQISRLARLVQRGGADKVFSKQLFAAAQGGAGKVCVDLRLAKRLFGERRLHFLQLAQPRLGLGQGHIGLVLGGLEFVGRELHQQVPRPHGLALLHRHAHHGAGDLGANINTVRVFHPATGHHGLYKITLQHRLAHHLGALPPAQAQEAARQHGAQGQQDPPKVFSKQGQGGHKWGPQGKVEKSHTRGPTDERVHRARPKSHTRMVRENAAWPPDTSQTPALACRDAPRRSGVLPSRSGAPAAKRFKIRASAGIRVGIIRGRPLPRKQADARGALAEAKQPNVAVSSPFPPRRGGKGAGGIGGVNSLTTPSYQSTSYSPTAPPPEPPKHRQFAAIANRFAAAAPHSQAATR